VSTSMKTKIIIGLIIVAALGGFALSSYINRIMNAPGYSASISTAPAYSVKPIVNTKAVIISGLEKSTKLITNEMDMVCDIAVNDTWLDLSIFSKEQIFSFEGHAAYSADLANISADDIVADNDAYTVKVYIDEPSVYNIYIDPESIRTKEIKNGLLRFGEVSLAEVDIRALMVTAEEQMKATAENDENMQKARENTVQSVTELFGKILTNAGLVGYEIIVIFK